MGSRVDIVTNILLDGKEIGNVTVEEIGVSLRKFRISGRDFSEEEPVVLNSRSMSHLLKKYDTLLDKLKEKGFGIKHYIFRGNFQGCRYTSKYLPEYVK